MKAMISEKEIIKTVRYAVERIKTLPYAACIRRKNAPIFFKQNPRNPAKTTSVRMSGLTSACSRVSMAGKFCS